MALVNVIKWEANIDELVHKFPIEDLKAGSQLVVYPSQTALFVKGGQYLMSLYVAHILSSPKIYLY